MGECKCKHLQYLNGTVAREVNPECTAHEDPPTLWEYIKTSFIVVAGLGTVILLFWGFMETCKDPNGQECKDLMYQIEMSSD